MKKLKCDWCGQPGQIIGRAKSFPGTRIVKCNVCCHEWEVILDEKDFTTEDKQDKSRWRTLVERILKREKG